MATMTIDGRRVAGDGAYAVVNPATEERFADAPACTRAQLDEAMDSALRAFRTWRQDVSTRRHALVRCAEIVEAHAEELAGILTRENGKPLAKALREAMRAAMWFRYTATLDFPIDVVQDDAQVRIEVRRRPHGVVGAITPWNYPVMLAAWKIAPAIYAGNTVVLKPSPFAPLATLRLGDLLQRVLPRGVVNIVSGGDDVGRWITSHPTVRKISFTGSAEAGKQVAAVAALGLKRTTLELGGNDAAIVLGDVDPAVVARKIFWGAFENTGQVCCSIKRLFVHERVYAPLLAQLSELARSARVGNGLTAETELGPLSNLRQFERVTELVDEAKRGGAKIVTGGERLGSQGYFFAPTLVTDLPDESRLVAEEQFGPALPCLVFSDIDEAIARANDTNFGLSGSVWSADKKRAVEIAGQLECGTVWVNEHLSVVPGAPFSGLKESGVGVENGPWGLLSMTELHTIEIPK